jgi:hypothetical protein
MEDRSNLWDPEHDPSSWFALAVAVCAMIGLVVIYWVLP